MKRFSNKERLLVAGLVLGVILVVDYYRVACCKADFGCVKCQSYIEHYFG